MENRSATKNKQKQKLTFLINLLLELFNDYFQNGYFCDYLFYYDESILKSWKSFIEQMLNNLAFFIVVCAISIQHLVKMVLSSFIHENINIDKGPLFKEIWNYSAFCTISKTFKR